ncbi:MAG TPA: superoxide dismutase [Methanomicrobiales archaeon]|nr:superoxide dismutase [Methanomicrobiales archaeon]
MAGTYTLPELGYDLKALAPYISEAQLTLHYQKHHQAYVTGANALFEKFDKARKEGSDLDLKAALKELSFHVGGHRLHTAFWENLAPAGKGGGGEPKGALAKAINADFGSFARFRKEFTATATSVEGSGWAALTFSRTTGRLLLVQIEKHNVNVPPGSPILLVLDVWEHAYYLDYRNDRAKFVESFWNIVNWDAVNRRYEAALKI